MKITIMALHLGFGGVEKYIITIANMLCEKYEVEIISTYKMNEKPSFPLNNKIKVTYLLQDLKPNKLELNNAIKNKKIFKIIKEGYKSIKILRLKKKLNIKAIQNLDCEIIISTRDFHNELIQKYASERIVKITTEHNHHNNDQEYIKKVVSSCNKFDYMLPISKELTTFYQDRLPDVDVRFIPFCIEKPTIESNPSFEKPIYISVGRLSKEKGTLDLIDIFNKIVKKQSDAVLHLVGDGTLMEEVRKKIYFLNLEKHIIIHGFLKKYEIDQLYSESSIYLMTSYTESFGFVLLEAMACGLPCVVFDSAQGASEIIKDSINGYLIHDRDFDLFVDTTINLYNNKAKLKELSNNAKDCLKDFSYDNTKKLWIEFIEEVRKEH